MIQAQSADGVIHQFPDGTNPAVIDGAMKAYVTQAKGGQKPAAKPSDGGVVGQVTGFMANVNRGLGIGDELAAGAKTAGNIFAGKTPLDVQSIGADFKGSMAHQRQIEDGYAAEHPHMAALGKGVGMAATAAVPAGDAANMFAQGARGLNAATATNAARGAVTAGVQAAGYAAADRGTLSERLGAAARAARDPATLAIGAVAGGAATPGAAKITKPAARNLDQLQTAKTAAYQAADAAGVRYTPQAFDNFVSSLTADAAAAKLNPMRHPRAASMLQDIQSLQGHAPSLTEMDQLRQVIRRDVAKAPDDAERFFGQRMIKQLDQFIDGAGPADVVSGSAGNAADLIRNARDLNTRVRKVQAVQDAVESARLRAGSTGSGGNADNATRQNLRRLLENTPNWTGDEKAALESIVMGGKGQNLLRLVGKLSPSGNGLMAAGNLGAAAMGGPLGAVPGAAGLAAKLAADNMTHQKVQGLIRLMSTGGQKGARVTGAAGASLPAVAAARLSRAAGVAGGARASAGENPFAQPVSSSSSR